MLLVVLAAVAIGLAIAPWLPGSPWPLMALPLLALLRGRPESGRSIDALRWGLAALLLVAPSAWWANVRAPHEAASDVAGLAPRRFLRVEGVVLTPPVAKDGLWRAEVAVDHLGHHAQRAASGNLIVAWPAAIRPHPGERWRFAGRLRRPQPPDNPGGFDYTAFLARQGIYTTMRAEEGTCLGPDAAKPWIYRLDCLRQRLLSGLGNGLSREDAALFGSLVLGGGAAPVDEGTSEAFRRVGLAHSLAASGTQVALLMAVLYAGLRLLRLPPAWAAALTAPWLLLYLALTGAPASMVRATLMGLVGLGALALGRRNVPFAALHLTALVMLVAEPAVLYDLGFQFSALATYGLIRLAVAVERAPAALPRRLLGLVLVPVAALAWVSPWQLAVFNTWSWWALPANWLSGPIIEALTPWGLLLAVLGLVSPPLVGWLNGATHGALWLLTTLVGWLASRPGTQVSVGDPGPVALVAVYGALGCGLRHPRLAIACALAAVVGHQAPVARGELLLATLSVGQGDAIAIRTPRGRWILVDGGPAGHGFDAGRERVLPWLRRMGCNRVALMVATHAHLDHVGGLASLARALPVTAAWDAGQSEGGSGEEVLLAAWLRGGVPWAIAGPKRVWRGDGVTLEAIAPRRPAETLNDGSVVLRLVYGRFRALLAGDLEEAGEQDLLRSGEDLRADVLKVAHHGSRTSTTPAWVRSVRPELALVSVGAHNTFGHPNPGVLARLRQAGAIVRRTDRQGAVLVRSNGRVWSYTDATTHWQTWRQGPQPTS